MKHKWKIIGGLSVVVVVAICIIINILMKPQYRIITDKNMFDEYYKKNDPSIVFIDLREEEDYEIAHLDKFLNVPASRGYEVLNQFLLENGYKQKEIVIMCYASKKASEAFNYLMDKGYDKLVVVNIESSELLEEYNDYISTGACNCLD